MADTQKDRVLENLNFESDRISSQVRQISLGALALVWALLVGTEQIAQPVRTVSLLRIALLAVITLGIDFFQYVSAVLASRKAWEDLRSGGSGTYQRSWLTWRAREWCFWGKIIACAMNVALMLWVLSGSLI